MNWSSSKRKRDKFAISGPRHLQNPNWFNGEHRPSIAASLVNGVYVLQKDKNPSSSQALAPPWWTFFDFVLTESFEDPKDKSIFCAVFEKNGVAVVAFRGTIFKRDTFRRDFEADLQIIINGLHKSSKFDEGLKAVRSSIKKYGKGNVCLAGHSLGAGIAMTIGREICEVDGFQLECHLFNPPFPSLPVECREKLKLGIHVAHSFVTATFKERGRDAHDAFDSLHGWIPNLYVNPRDVICSGYIGYFGNRERMEELGLGKIRDIAAPQCIKEFIISAFGKKSKALHLIPSARLIVNPNPSSDCKKAHFWIKQCWSDFKKAHGIQQWWSPEQQFQSSLFTLP